MMAHTRVVLVPHHLYVYKVCVLCRRTCLYCMASRCDMINDNGAVKNVTRNEFLIYGHNESTNTYGAVISLIIYLTQWLMFIGKSW